MIYLCFELIILIMFNNKTKSSKIKIGINDSQNNYRGLRIINRKFDKYKLIWIISEFLFE